MKDYHGTWHFAALRGGLRPPRNQVAEPPPNQLAPLRSRLRQASSTTQLGTAPLSDAK